MSVQRVVLIEYFVIGDTTLIFAVREDFNEPQVVEIKMSLDVTRQFINTSFSKGNKEKQNMDEWQMHFGSLIELVLSSSNEGDIIWFVPHDALHYVPLHALKIEDRYLIERNPVCYSPSASIMKYCRNNRKSRREKALVLGDSRQDRPLPFAQEEAFTVAEIFDTTPYIGSQATKSLVKEKLEKEFNDFDILHFSCHGNFRFDQALKSGIMLAPEDGNETDVDEKWNLTAEEIFGLSIGADLVTLSSCESGVSQNRPGDELIGLTRSLIYAGAASIVASLWLVNDLSTRFLMERFYQELKRGSSKVEALQQAQIYVMNMTPEQCFDYLTYKKRQLGNEADQRRYNAINNIQSIIERGLDDLSKKPLNKDKIEKCFSHPYFWAPFILIGDWN